MYVCEVLPVHGSDEESWDPAEVNAHVRDVNASLHASLRGATIVPTAAALLEAPRFGGSADAPAPDDADWPPALDAPPPKRLFHADGLHLSERGYEALVAALCTHVPALLPRKGAASDRGSAS